MKTPSNPRGLPPPKRTPPVSRMPPPVVQPPSPYIPPPTVKPPSSNIPPPTIKPPVQPVAPAIIPPPALLNDPPWVLLAKAAGVYHAEFADAGVSDMPRGAPQQPLYEKSLLWAICPVVGSGSMLFQGKTAFHKLAGGVFLALDLTMVGPVMKGIVIGTRAAASAGLKLVMNRSGTVLQQQAMTQFIKSGGQLVTREAAEAAIQAKLRDGNVLIVGAETSANAYNHVVAYMVEQGTGTVWRLHGGITQLAYLPRKYVEREALTKTVGQLNTMNMYHLAASPAEVAAWWGKFAGSNPISAFLRGGMPKGCAGSNVLLLEYLSKQGAIQGLPTISGAARWMPLYLDRALGGYVLNPVNVLKGTMAHGALAAGGGSIAALAMKTITYTTVDGYLPQQGYNFEWSDLLPGNSFGMVSDFYADSPGMQVPGILAVPNATFSMDIRNSATAFPPGGLSVKLPPPYVKIEDVQPAPPPTVALNVITGTWSATENGTTVRIEADNYKQPPGVWLIKMFIGAAKDPFRIFQVKMRGADGKYYNYPFVADNYILKYQLIGARTMYEFDGPIGAEKVKRTWSR